jgi:hypothetical protein
MAAIYPATARELDPWSSSPSTCSSVSSTSSVAAEGYHGHVGVVVRDDELVLEHWRDDGRRSGGRARPRHWFALAAAQHRRPRPPPYHVVA